jgi:hypothetical protein
MLSIHLEPGVISRAALCKVPSINASQQAHRVCRDGVAHRYGNEFSGMSSLDHPKFALLGRRSLCQNSSLTAKPVQAAGATLAKCLIERRVNDADRRGRLLRLTPAANAYFHGTCAASLDCFFDPVDLMSGKIVQKDDVTLLQSWSKDLFDVGQEVGAVHWRAGPGNLDRTIGAGRHGPAFSLGFSTPLGTERHRTNAIIGKRARHTMRAVERMTI